MSRNRLWAKLGVPGNPDSIPPETLNLVMAALRLNIDQRTALQALAFY